MNACFQSKAVKFIKSRAMMPSSLKYGGNRYYHLGLVAYYEGLDYPTTFADAPRRGRKILTYYSRVHVGDTDRSAGVRLEDELSLSAERQSSTLNGECFIKPATSEQGACQDWGAL
jgi:hypothetical protein